MTRAIGLVAVLAVSASLAACEGQRVGPISIQRDDSELVVAVCEHIDARELWFDQDRRDGRGWVTFWKSNVELELAPGDSISTDLDTTPQQVGGQRVSPELAPGDRLDLQIDGVDASQFVAAFTIPEEGLSESGWLHPDGTVTAEACP